jgi:hypothetical protein
MTDERIVEEMARLDGFTKKPKMVNGPMGEQECMIWHKGDEFYAHCEMPPYLTSHDAVQRVIDGLSDEELHEAMMYALPEGKVFPDLNWARTTTRKQCEAILKAKGVR